MKTLFRNVRGLGNVALSNTAQRTIREQEISEEDVALTLTEPEREAPGGRDIVFRERKGIRAVIITHPRPDKGNKVVKTIHRIDVPPARKS